MIGNNQIPTGLKESTPITCDECGGALFESVYHFRKVSALLSGTGQEQIHALPVFSCKSCGHVNEDFMPEFR